MGRSSRKLVNFYLKCVLYVYKENSISKLFPYTAPRQEEGGQDLLGGHPPGLMQVTALEQR